MGRRLLYIQMPGEVESSQPQHKVYIGIPPHSGLANQKK